MVLKPVTMGLAIVRYSSIQNVSENFLRRLEERLCEKDLSYYASRLLDHGLENEVELEKALSKAMAVICSARMTCSNHFKKVYISRTGKLQADWLVSSLGMRMIIMQVNTNDPGLAAMQVSILSSAH